MTTQDYTMGIDQVARRLCPIEDGVANVICDCPVDEPVRFTIGEENFYHCLHCDRKGGAVSLVFALAAFPVQYLVRTLFLGTHNFKCELVNELSSSAEQTLREMIDGERQRFGDSYRAPHSKYDL